MPYLGFIREDCIIPALQATDKEGAIRELVQSLTKAGCLTAESETAVVEAVLEREKKGSTGIGNGLAIPHVKSSPLVSELLGAFGRVADGVDYRAVDGEPVHLLFLMLSPEGVDPKVHLEILKRISGLAREEFFCRFLRDARDKSEIVATLEESESVWADK